MPDNNFYYNPDDMQDISSNSSKSVPKQIKTVTSNYGNGVFKNIGNIIKAISFIVSIGILVLCAALAFVLVTLDKFFIVIAIAVVIVGIVLALITLFLIYGMGHIISQNDEILRRL